MPPQDVERDGNRLPAKHHPDDSVMWPQVLGAGFSLQRQFGVCELRNDAPQRSPMDVVHRNAALEVLAFTEYGGWVAATRGPQRSERRDRQQSFRALHRRTAVGGRLQKT